MSPIKDFKLVYEAPNTHNLFSQGDTVSGVITFTLTEETKVKKLYVKIKGDANVHWTTGTGDRRRSHSDHRRYFKVKQYVVAEDDKDTVLPKGDHHFKFRLEIPHGDMPSSFRGFHGRIVYMLEAIMSRSWRMSSRKQTELNFVTKSLLQHSQVMVPHSASVGKDVGVFSKGQVQMSATVDRMVCSPGDTLTVVATICNSSSKEIRPKFSVQQKTVYRAHASTKMSNQSLCKIVGDNVKQKSEETVSCKLMIPVNTIPTVQNCEIITVDYYLKVYLDISFAFDPEVKFPLVIVPSGLAGSHPAAAIGAPSCSDFPPPSFPVAPYAVPTGPPAYGYPAPDPNQYVNVTSGYNNQWPQQPAAFGFSNPVYPPSLGPQQAPIGQPPFQQEELPTYFSLFPPSHEMDKKN